MDGAGKRAPRAPSAICRRWLAAGRSPFPASVASSVRFEVSFPAMTRSAATLVLLFLSGCFTAGASSPVAASVLREVPDETCERLGAMAVRTSTDLLISEDVLHASAEKELRERAAVRGATHLVVDPSSSPATVAYTSSALASGVAYRCAD